MSAHLLIPQQCQGVERRNKAGQGTLCCPAEPGLAEEGKEASAVRTDAGRKHPSCREDSSPLVAKGDESWLPGHC